MVYQDNLVLCVNGIEIRNRPEKAAMQKSFSSLIDEKAVEARKLNGIYGFQNRDEECEKNLAQLVFGN